MRSEIAEIFHDIIERKVRERSAGSDLPEKWDLDGLRENLRGIFLIDVDFSKADAAALSQDALVLYIEKAAALAYERREQELGPDLMRRLEGLVFLQIIDKNWRDHLYELDRVKEGIGLRAYGQKDPLAEYKSEAFDMFMSMVESIQEEAVQFLFRAQIAAPPPERSTVAASRAYHPDAQDASRSAVGPTSSATTPPEFGAPTAVATRTNARAERDEPEGGPRAEPVRKAREPGRNDPCPCGSGKKYKKCCGRDRT